MTPDLHTLLAKLESPDLDVGDREVNDQVLLACGWQMRRQRIVLIAGREPQAEDYVVAPEHWDEYDHPRPFPLRNLQDALDCLPEDWSWSVSSYGTCRIVVRFTPCDERRWSSPSRCVCVANIRARIWLAEQGGTQG